MARPDRSAYARRNAPVLLALFGLAVVAGVVLANWAAIAGGALGLAWVWRAMRTGA